jgi:hypothetical protein
MGHKSRFTFRTHGGVTAGEEWIYDGEQPLARLERVTIEQPEQNLRYFDRNLKPVNLRDLRLSPGGRPLVSGVQMFWNLGPGIITSELVEVRTEGEETDRFVLTVITADPGGVATSTRVLTLSFDDDSGSYVYDFTAHLQVHSPEVFDLDEAGVDIDSEGGVRFEYCDPWYCDVPAPTVEFSGMWPKRYSHLLAECGDGTVWQMPLNHMATGIPGPRSFVPDGLFVLAHDPGNNPAFQFVGDTGARTHIGVCNWGYDIHLLARYGCDELYDSPPPPRFRIRLCPDEKARDLLDRAAPVPKLEYHGFPELPLYERTTSFEKGLRLDQPSPGRTDPWPWLPRGDGTDWCRTEGRSDRCSLKISKDTPGPSEWVMDRESDGAWTQNWTPATGFRVTVFARTETVEGRGSFLSIRWVAYNYPQRFPYVSSSKLTGSHDWTELQVEIQGPAPPDISAVCLVLRQDGSGTTWFDDLKVTLITLRDT